MDSKCIESIDIYGNHFYSFQDRQNYKYLVYSDQLPEELKVLGEPIKNEVLMKRQMIIATFNLCALFDIKEYQMEHDQLQVQTLYDILSVPFAPKSIVRFNKPEYYQNHLSIIENIKHGRKTYGTSNGQINYLQIYKEIPETNEIVIEGICQNFTEILKTASEKQKTSGFTRDFSFLLQKMYTKMLSLIRKLTFEYQILQPDISFCNIVVTTQGKWKFLSYASAIKIGSKKKTIVPLLRSEFLHQSYQNMNNCQLQQCYDRSVKSLGILLVQAVLVTYVPQYKLQRLDLEKCNTYLNEFKRNSYISSEIMNLIVTIFRKSHISSEDHEISLYNIDDEQLLTIYQFTDPYIKSFNEFFKYFYESSDKDVKRSSSSQNQEQLSQQEQMNRYLYSKKLEQLNTKNSSIIYQKFLNIVKSHSSYIERLKNHLPNIIDQTIKKMQNESSFCESFIKRLEVKEGVKQGDQTFFPEVFGRPQSQQPNERSNYNRKDYNSQSTQRMIIDIQDGDYKLASAILKYNSKIEQVQMKLTQKVLEEDGSRLFTQIFNGFSMNSVIKHFQCNFEGLQFRDNIFDELVKALVNNEYCELFELFLNNTNLRTDQIVSLKNKLDERKVTQSVFISYQQTGFANSVDEDAKQKSEAKKNLSKEKLSNQRLAAVQKPQIAQDIHKYQQNPYDSHTQPKGKRDANKSANIPSANQPSNQQIVVNQQKDSSTHNEQEEQQSRPSFMDDQDSNIIGPIIVDDYSSSAQNHFAKEESSRRNDQKKDSEIKTNIPEDTNSKKESDQNISAQQSSILSVQNDPFSNPSKHNFSQGQQNQSAVLESAKEVNQDSQIAKAQKEQQQETPKPQIQNFMQSEEKPTPREPTPPPRAQIQNIPNQNKPLHKGVVRNAYLERKDEDERNDSMSVSKPIFNPSVVSTEQNNIQSSQPQPIPQPKAKSDSGNKSIHKQPQNKYEFKKDYDEQNDSISVTQQNQYPSVLSAEAHSLKHSKLQNQNQSASNTVEEQIMDSLLNEANSFNTNHNFKQGQIQQNQQTIPESKNEEEYDQDDYPKINSNEAKVESPKHQNQNINQNQEQPLTPSRIKKEEDSPNEKKPIFKVQSNTYHDRKDQDEGNDSISVTVPVQIQSRISAEQNSLKFSKAEQQGQITTNMNEVKEEPNLNESDFKDGEDLFQSNLIPANSIKEDVGEKIETTSDQQNSFHQNSEEQDSCGEYDDQQKLISTSNHIKTTRKGLKGGDGEQNLQLNEVHQQEAVTQPQYERIDKDQSNVKYQNFMNEENTDQKTSPEQVVENQDKMNSRCEIEQNQKTVDTSSHQNLEDKNSAGNNIHDNLGQGHDNTNTFEDIYKQQLESGIHSDYQQYNSGRQLLDQKSSSDQQQPHQISQDANNSCQAIGVEFYHEPQIQYIQDYDDDDDDENVHINQ